MHDTHLLARIPLFSTLTHDQRVRLAHRMTERRVPAGQIVFNAGDPGGATFVVVSGAIEIFLPSPETSGVEAVTLRDVRAGDYFGELAVLGHQPRTASARAVTDSVLLELTREQFEAHVREHADVAMALLADMAERLRETNALLSQRKTKNAVAEVEENLSWSERLADRVAELNGSWAFILCLGAVTVSWTMINLPAISSRLGLGSARGGFDPYPYIFYNLVLAILVALQGPLIVMSQNRQSLKDRRQAEADFHVNVKNEVNIEALRRELAALRAELMLRLDTGSSRSPSTTNRTDTERRS